MDQSILEQLYTEREFYKVCYKKTKNPMTRAILRGKIQGIAFAIELLN